MTYRLTDNNEPTDFINDKEKRQHKFSKSNELFYKASSVETLIEAWTQLKSNPGMLTPSSETETLHRISKQWFEKISEKLRRGDMRYVRYFALLYLLLIVDQTSYWYGCSSLVLGVFRKKSLNLACLEKADDLAVYVNEVLLELILMVKVKLLEFQFLEASYVGTYLGDTRIRYFDTCNGYFYRYTCQIKCLSIKLVKEISEKPRSIAEYNVRNVRLSSVRKCMGNGGTIVTFAGHNCQL